MADEYYQLASGYVLSLKENTPFPELTKALTTPNGLIAIDGDLSTNRLLEAYKRGIFPWFSEGEPIMWWSPDPRMVLFPSELKISNSLRKTLKKQSFELRLNTAFRDVITACSQVKRSNQLGTWISHEMIDAYSELQQLGYAISSECWFENRLVGGCYGVMIGKMFYGESMFHTKTDASKLAFVHLVQHLKASGVSMIDCQMKTPLLESFGGREIPRNTFIEKLNQLISQQ